MPPDVKALGFDVFGTVVDWRNSIAREVEEFGRTHKVTVDAMKFAVAWRGLYQPYMDKVRHGAIGWTKLDDLHRMAVQVINLISPSFRSFSVLGEGGQGPLDTPGHGRRRQLWPAGDPKAEADSRPVLSPDRPEGRVACVRLADRNGALVTRGRVLAPSSAPRGWPQIPSPATGGHYGLCAQPPDFTCHLLTDRKRSLAQAWSRR